MRTGDFGIDAASLAGPLDAKLAAMREGGFARVVVDARELVAHPGGLAAALRCVGDGGLRVAGLSGLRDLEGLSGPWREQAFGHARTLLRLARDAGAETLLLRASTLAHADADEAAVVADLRRLSTLAVPLGLRIGLEASPRARLVRTQAQAWRLVERVDQAGFGLVLDAGRWLDEGAPTDLVDDIDPRRLLMVRLWDALPEPSPPARESVPSAALRVFPGEGARDGPLSGLLRRLRDAGYGGDWIFTVENGDPLPLPPASVVERARRARQWSGAGAIRRDLPVRRDAARR